MLTERQRGVRAFVAHGVYCLRAGCATPLRGVERAAQYIRGPNTGKVRRFVKATTYSAAEYWPTAEHYLFGLYSKFVQRGAKRI